jgi:hypothetical protein
MTDHLMALAGVILGFPLGLGFLFVLLGLGEWLGRWLSRRDR